MNRIISLFYRAKYRLVKVFYQNEKHKKLNKIDFLLKLVRLLKIKGVKFRLSLKNICIDDLVLRVNSSDLQVYYQIFILEEYKKTLNLLENKNVFCSRPVILDIGANIGLSALYFKESLVNSKIYTCEPFHENFNRIPKQFQSYQYALWSKNANLKIDRSFRDGKEWSIRVLEDLKGTINGRTLDSIMSEIKLTEVDLLKIDIEGSEFEVFLNDKQMSQNLKKVKAIVIEIHDECGDRKELISFFQSCNFIYEPLGELDLFYKN